MLLWYKPPRLPRSSTYIYRVYQVCCSLLLAAMPGKRFRLCSWRLPEYHYQETRQLRWYNRNGMSPNRIK